MSEQYVRQALSRLGRALVGVEAASIAAQRAVLSPDHGRMVDAYDRAVAEVNVARREVDVIARATAPQSYDELRTHALHLEQGGAPTEQVAAAWAAADAVYPCVCAQADCDRCSGDSWRQR